VPRVAVIADVAVIAPMIVAALGNGNDTVGLIDAVDEGTTQRGRSAMRVRPGVSTARHQARARRCSTEWWQSEANRHRLTVSITTTVSFPFPSAATIRVADHDHGHIDDPERSTPLAAPYA